MIAEISYWKHELSEIRDGLKEAIREMESLEIDIASSEYFETLGGLNFKMERALFFSALAIRRIFEADTTTRKCNPNALEWNARTVSDDLKSKNFKFPILKHNDQLEQLTILKIAKELIHSEYLSWSEAAEGTLEGFWIASESNQSKRVFLVKWPQFYSFLDMVISDRPDPFKAPRGNHAY